MKKNKKIKYLFLLTATIMLFTKLAYTQMDDCEAPTLGQYEYKIPDVFPGNMDDPIYINLFLHVGMVDGIPYLNEEEIVDLKDEIMTRFGPWNIFFNYCIDYIDCPCDPNYIDLLYETFSIDHGINVYFVENGANPNSGGIPSRNIMVTHILHTAHEIGHALGLNHTFHGTQCSEPDGLPEYAPYYDQNDIYTKGPDCENRGDFICDTPANPYKRNSGDPDSQGCFYFTSYVDENGNVSLPCHFFNPDPDNMIYQDLLGYPFIDPDNVLLENLMSYGKCREPYKFTKDQNKRMRNMIYYDPLLIDILSDFESETQITSDQVWTEDKVFQSDVVVEEGVSLTIESTISFVPGTGLILEKGAILLLSGTLTVSDLTPTCGAISTSGLWKGITVLTGNYGDGISTNIWNGGVIEHAEIGIKIDEDHDGLFLVYTQNAVFKNNEKAFMNIGNLRGVTWFRNTDFIIDNEYLSNNYFGQIQLEHARALVKSCNFRDLVGHGSEHNRSAIIAFNSNLRLFTLSGEDKNLISNFTSGVFLASAYSNKIADISDTDFTNNLKAIESNAYQNVMAENNLFELDSGSSNFVLSDKYGIYLFSPFGLECSQNTFQNSANSPQSIGAYVRFSAGSSKSMSDNVFSNLDTAIITDADNSKLKFLCNHFVNNSFRDIKILSDRISSFQGSSGVPAGNKFSHTGFEEDSDFSNEQGTNNMVKYYYYKDDPLQVPVYYSNIKIFGLLEENSTCNTLSVGVTFEEIDSIYTEKKEDWDSRIDGADPEIVEVCGGWVYTPTEVVTIVLELSPWLSVEAASALLSNADNYTEEQIIQVLSNNPDVMDDPSINNYVFDADSYLSPASIATIQSSMDTLTERGMLAADISMTELKREEVINENLKTVVLMDEVNYDSLRYWLSKKNTLESDIGIAESFADQRDYNQALIQLNDIQQSPDLTSDEAADMTNYIQLNTILYNLFENHKYERSLAENEISNIEQIANGPAYIAANKARVLLNYFFDYNYDLLDDTPDLTIFPPPMGIPPRSSDNTKIVIVPNPNEGHFVLHLPESMAGTKTLFILFDSSGKKLYQIEINTAKGKSSHKIDLTSVPEGIYLYDLSSNSEHFTGKISNYK